MNVLYKLDGPSQEAATQYEALWLKFFMGLRPTWLTNMVAQTIRLGPKFLRARFPVGIGALEFKRMNGPIEYVGLTTKYTELDYAIWQAGLSVDVDVLRSGMWTGWDGGQLEMFALAAEQLRCQRAMVALEAGISFVDWDSSVAFPTTFFGEHPWNPADPDPLKVNDNTIYNFTVDADGVDAVKSRFRSFKGPMGQPLGLQLAGFLAHPDAMVTWENLLIPPNATPSGQIVIATGGGATNPARHTGRYWLSETIESTIPEVTYAIATNRPDMRAVHECIKGSATAVNVESGTVTGDEEFETVIEDLSSQFYKNTNHVAIGTKRRLEAKTGAYTAVIRLDTRAAPP